VEKLFMYLFAVRLSKERRERLPMHRALCAAHMRGFAVNVKEYPEPPGGAKQEKTGFAFSLAALFPKMRRLFCFTPSSITAKEGQKGYLMDLQQASDQVVLIITQYGLSVLGALIILIVGYYLSKKIPALLRKIMDKRGIDATVSGFLSRIAKFAILVFTVLLVLSQFGIQTASLIAVLGAAGLAIGLALQGTLSNVAGGVMLLIFRPIKVGQYVEVGGHGGTVKDISLFTTELATVDNIQVIIPNGSVWGNAIRNFSFHPTRRMDLLIGISYEDDIDKARGIIERLALADERSHKDPAPLIEVAELADNSVNFTVRVWCDSGNYFPLKFALTKAIKQTFDAEGISIPYPQRTVHVVKEG
tara:strand:+ start:248 stop:1327 length:1080 start_codon:yes stop_codon:yes gene_type:complete